MEVLNLDEVLKILFMYEVRVKYDKLIVKGGDRFPPHVRSAIYSHKQEILDIYGKEQELMDMIDEMERKAKAAESDMFEDAPDLWNRYYMLSESLKIYLPKPWAIVPEDEKRCSYCPNLGKPASDGVICDYECKAPY